MEEKLDLILIKLKNLEEKLNSVSAALDAHRTEHTLQKVTGSQMQGPPGMPPTGGGPGGYGGGGIPFGPPNMMGSPGFGPPGSGM
jgi:hypothetical protein